jgi:threonyl-tRNA synthetase
LPNGTIIKYQIENFIHDLLAFNGYQFVQTPVLGSKQLYVTSGHWVHYRDNMFPPLDVDGEILELRPMTCPHHLLIYQRKPHSYRELPIRYAEHAILHRYEASGALTGLERVRSMQLVDTHLICAHSQIKQEVKHSYKMIKEAHRVLGTTIHAVDLSLHDPQDKTKFFDNESMWQNAENQLRAALKSLKIAYREVIGEAAFYGPKIDLQVKTALGHIITVSTIQLDFLLPERFQLTYKDHTNAIAKPILIHAGIIGTFERYLSILIEQNKGVFPL